MSASCDSATRWQQRRTKRSLHHDRYTSLRRSSGCYIQYNVRLLRYSEEKGNPRRDAGAQIRVRHNFLNERKRNTSKCRTDPSGIETRCTMENVVDGGELLSLILQGGESASFVAKESPLRAKRVEPHWR